MGRAFEFRKARKMKRWSAMSKAFTRIGKDIVMAVKEGGPDPSSNARLRAVIQLNGHLTKAWATSRKFFLRDTHLMALPF